MENSKDRIGFRIGKDGPPFWFTPKPDITAFELAACMEILMTVNYLRENVWDIGGAERLTRKWEAMSGAAKRHFEEKA